MYSAAATDRCTNAVRGAQLGVKRGARPRTRVVHKTRCGFYDRPSVNPGKVSIEPASTNREFADAMSALQAGKLGDAERLCKAVLRSEPKHVEALTLLGAVLGRLGRNADKTAPFEFLAISASPEDQLTCTKQCLADQPSHPAVWRGEKYTHDRIRIGYFSADFRNHPVGRLAVGLLEAHDKSHFTTLALSSGPDDGSELRRRTKSAVDDFVDVRNRSDADVAALIRRREIDIVVDLTGFTLAGRFGVLARRAAPIQVNFLGYPATMGADWIDYIIADRTIIPAEHFQFYGERVVWLPDTYQANDDKSRIAERVPTRAECGLPKTGFVFCCFNDTCKWMRLLAATANSVLWLLGTN